MSGQVILGGLQRNALQVALYVPFTAGREVVVKFKSLDFIDYKGRQRSEMNGPRSHT